MWKTLNYQEIPPILEFQSLLFFRVVRDLQYNLITPNTNVTLAGCIACTYLTLAVAVCTTNPATVPAMLNCSPPLELQSPV